MKKNNQNNQPLFNKQVQLILNFLLISIMLTCVAFIVDRFILSIYPIWGSYWFPFLTLLIAPASLFIRRNQQNAPSTFENQTFFILSEIVLIVLITKAISMFSMRFFGISTLWQEFASWPQDFLPTFFNLDFLIRAFAIFIIWMLTWLFSFPLNKLEEDESLMEQEKLGFTFTDRYDARRKLIGLIFNTGILMILLMMVLKSNQFSFFQDLTPTGLLIGVVLVYYFTGFIFMAINQYAIMKARWYFNDIEVSPQLAKRWLFYSTFFLIIVLIIVAFLPTNLPLGISSVAQWLSEAFVYIASILFSIITFPIFLLLALISRLYGREAIDQPFTPSEPETNFLPQIMGSTPWLDVVRSIFFWLTFTGVVLAAIIYYINNKPNFSQFLRELRLFALLKELWHLIKRGVKETQGAASETFKTGIDKFQAFLRNQRDKIRQSSYLINQLPPRRAVIKVYTEWVHWNQQHGLTRKDTQTPYEYAQAYTRNNPEVADLIDPINVLTEIFIQARYSRHPVLKTQAQQAQEIAKHLKMSLKQKRDILNAKEISP